jgi:hypothetical protein
MSEFFNHNDERTQNTSKGKHHKRYLNSSNGISPMSNVLMSLE